MTYSLTGMTTLGNVTKEQSSKDAGLFQMPMPGSDASSSILLDIFGTSRVITINGVYTGATTSDITTFIGLLDALVDGAQPTAGLSYHSDKSNTSYTVLVTGVQWEAEPGTPLAVNYSITMSEGHS